MLFFFFKLKTTDEVHISDWSSDVCSSDLLVELRHRPHTLERFARIIDLEVFDLPCLESDLVGRLVTVRVTGRIVDLHLVETGGQRLYLIQALEDRPVLQARHAGGDEDSEMADMRVRQVADALSGPFELLRILLDNRDPAESLVRRGDVVAGGGAQE